MSGCGSNTINLWRRVQSCLAGSGRHDQDRVLSDWIALLIGESQQRVKDAYPVGCSINGHQFKCAVCSHRVEWSSITLNLEHSGHTQLVSCSVVPVRSSHEEYQSREHWKYCQRPSTDVVRSSSCAPKALIWNEFCSNQKGRVDAGRCSCMLLNGMRSGCRRTTHLLKASSCTTRCRSWFKTGNGRSTVISIILEHRLYHT